MVIQEVQEYCLPKPGLVPLINSSKVKWFMMAPALLG